MTEDNRGDRLPLLVRDILRTHSIVSNDLERARQFYPDVSAGEFVRESEPTMVGLGSRLDHPSTAEADQPRRIRR